jgi:broad specificity phosphatase PhoE
VAHDGVLRLALLALLGLPLGAFWRVPFVLCGITIVTIDGGATALRAHNLAEHLDGPVGQPEVARPGAL